MAKLNDIWGSKEAAYSSIIAQTIMLSKEVQQVLLAAAQMKQAGTLEQIKTEYSLSTEQSLPILAEFAAAIVGIDNQQGTGDKLQQLLLYDAGLRKIAQDSGKEYCLLYLHPSTRQLAEGNKPDGLIQWKYSDMLRELDKISTVESFYSQYLDMLREYLEELEVQPVAEAEIVLLSQIGPMETFLRKMRKTLDQLRRGDDGAIGENRGNNLLFSRKISEDLQMQIGFRFGTNWEYAEPLMGEQPECIVLIKDNWEAGQRERYEGILKEVEQKLLEIRMANGLKGAVNYYRTYKKGSCALAIRKPLRTFVNCEAGELDGWFKQTALQLESAVAAVVQGGGSND